MDRDGRGQRNELVLDRPRPPPLVSDCFDTHHLSSTAQDSPPQRPAYRHSAYVTCGRLQTLQAVGQVTISEDWGNV
jgi:hypothetical protein